MHEKKRKPRKQRDTDWSLELDVELLSKASAFANKIHLIDGNGVVPGPAAIKSRLRVLKRESAAFEGYLRDVQPHNSRPR